MKRAILLTQVIFFFLTVTAAYSQSGWFWQNPLPQGNELRFVKFINTQTGSAVGYGGTILRTTNGGTSWTSQTSGTIEHLFGVYFTDVNVGTAVGNDGTILKTLNGGTNWNTQTSGTTERLYSVYFPDVNNGTIVGQDGTILRTTNGGANWTSTI